MQADELISAVNLSCRHYFPPSASVLVAVSGGSDSVALFHLLDRAQRLLGISRIALAHVNHGLRGSESDLDESFVADLAQQNRLECFTKRLGGKTADTPGIEAWAREQRYAFLFSIKKEQKFDLIATGHTADDQAETVLMRLVRGAGITGLQGIHALRDDAVIRPLLTITKKMLIHWLTDNGYTWREDQTNQEMHFRRNQLRHSIMKDLAEWEPGAIGHLARFAQTMRSHRQVLLPIIQQWVSQQVLSRQTGEVVLCRLEQRGVTTEHYAIAEEGIAHLFRELEIEVTYYHVSAVRDVMISGHGCVLLPGKWKARGEGQIVRLSHIV